MKMSENAQDLINRMLQLEPNNRLGHNLESIEILKQHPFFTGIDWVAISKRNYKGVTELLKQKVEDAIANEI